MKTTIIIAALVLACIAGRAQNKSDLFISTDTHSIKTPDCRAVEFRFTLYDDMLITNWYPEYSRICNDSAVTVTFRMDERNTADRFYFIDQHGDTLLVWRRKK